ncbi:unnamed protein product [Durusdinium trenchii]|uniref:Asl1-like glycosyl hydrolase catalytic domain-containing protein n=1 Tax=Durusdinium trenchii TaxID=1381693 RepID=A0ABP0IVR9_9DINO
MRKTLHWLSIAVATADLKDPSSPLPTPAAALKLKKPPLHCGVGTNTFTDCPQCLESAMNSGAIDFWWNWDYVPKVDMSHLPTEVISKARKSFTPMIWGTKLPKNFSFFSLGSEYLMGFNEPDQYGPACAGELTRGSFGCGEEEYRPATSAGFAALFDPAKAAKEWQKLVNLLAEVPREPGAPLTRLAAPSMAQNAEPVDDCTHDPALPEARKYCRGWLQSFKAIALTLSCKTLSGRQTNCWDVIDALPIHGYARSAEEIKQKLQQYHRVFQEDFEGTQGRSMKKLWLTEVTMGSNEASELVSFVDGLMNAHDGLQNRELFSYVERISWFSEWSMGAFKLSSYVPHMDEAWSSSLFEPTTGHFTPHGQSFIRHCHRPDGLVHPGAADPLKPPPHPPAAAPLAPPPTQPRQAVCSVGAMVSCPGGGSCQGNQCCPDGSTCPSADASFKGCGDVKSEDCTKVSEEMHLLLLSALGPWTRE